jgi:hypothetical protein
VEADAPLFVVGVRRGATGRYRGRLIAVPVPSEGTRRARVTSVTEELARAYEAIVADAPEQWWSVFFPIWPDLEAAAAEAGADGAAAGPGASR